MNKNRKLINALLVSTMMLSNVAPVVLAANAAAATNDPTVVRLHGDTRVETSVEVSSTAYETAETVVVAGYNGHVDALTGTALASFKDAPLLIVSDKEEDYNAVKDEITRLGAKNVILLGDKNVVSESIFNNLKALDLNVSRVAGKDRLDTAAAVAVELGAKHDHVFLTNDGRNDGELADALAAGPVSGRDGDPILLTANNALSAQTIKALEAMEVKNVTIIGGESAVSKSVASSLENLNITVERVAGKDRWETAEAVANKYFAESSKVIVANDGRVSYADALVGGYLGAKEEAPVLLTLPGKLNTPTKNFLGSNATFAYVLGGEKVVSKAALTEIQAIVDKNNAAEETELNVESVKAINPTTLKIDFDKEVKEFDVKDITAKGLEFENARIEEKSVYVTVKNAKFNSKYTVSIKDQGEFEVAFGEVNDFYSLVIETDAKDSDSNTIPDIVADGSSTMMLTAKVYDLDNNEVEDLTGTVEFSATTGALAQNDIVIQNGKASVQLNSVSSADKTIYSTITAKVKGQSDLAGLLGELQVEFIPTDAEGAVQTAVPVVKAQTETADRVTVVLGQSRPDLSVKQLESIKDAITLIDSVDGRSVDVKEVRQLNDKLLEVVVDSYDGSGKNYLTDNAEHTISFSQVADLIVESELKFKLTDSTRQYALKADGKDQRTVEVTFENPVSTVGTSSALDLNNYLLDGSTLSGATKIDLKRDTKGNVVNEGKTVVIKLSPQDAIRSEQVVLQVRNVGDWAAVIDSSNRISTQDLFLTTIIDESIPKVETVRQSPEQFLLTFDKPVTMVGNKDIAELLDVRYGNKEAEKDGEGYKKGDLTNSLDGKVQITKLDANNKVVTGNGEFTQVLVELTEDWTKITGKEAFWVAASKLQFKLAKNAVQTDLGNKNLAIDEKIANPQDYTSPTITDFVQNSETVDKKTNLLASAQVTFSEPVQLDGLTSQGSGAPTTPNANQDNKIVVEFSKDGKVVQGELVNPAVKDFVLTVQPKDGGFDALKSAFDKPEKAVGTWKVTITGVADDYGNTMATQAFNFEVPGKADAAVAEPISIKPFVTYAEYEGTASGDVITVKFSEVMANKDAAGVGIVGNYILNSEKLSAASGAKIAKGIEGVTNDWDGITITLPAGSVEEPTFMLTLASNMKSADGQTLTGANKLNFVASGLNSEYIPNLVLTNKDEKAVELAKGLSTIASAKSTATGINADGDVTDLEIEVNFATAYSGDKALQVEVNNRPVTTFVSGTQIRFVLTGDGAKALKLVENDRVEVKVNGQTVHVGNAN